MSQFRYSRTVTGLLLPLLPILFVLEVLWNGLVNAPEAFQDAVSILDYVITGRE
jgi:hypothetical protein